MTLQQFMLGAVPPVPPPGSDYDIKVQGYSPLVFLPLSDGGGSVAVDYGSVGEDGAYGGSINNQAAAGIGDGTTGIELVNNSTGNVNFFSAALASAFNGDLGSLMIWWYRETISMCGSANPYWLFLDGSGHDIDLGYAYPAGDHYAGRTGATAGIIPCATQHDNGWLNWIITWDQAGDGWRVYESGSLADSDATISAWAGTLANAVLGARSGGNSMGGYYSKLAIFDTKLDGPAIADLQVIP